MKADPFLDTLWALLVEWTFVSRVLADYNKQTNKQTSLGQRNYSCDLGNNYIYVYKIGEKHSPKKHIIFHP